MTPTCSRPLAALSRAAVLSLLSAAPLLPAQQEGSVRTLDPVVVTGSRLPGDAFTSPVPVTVLGRDALEASGLDSLGDYLRTTPLMFFASTNESVAISGNRARVGAQLRGMDLGHTLVLVNGRRVTTGANTAGDSPFVNLNAMPVGFIERVEILHGGGAAVYGSDAMAGVINIITRRAPEGGQATVSYLNGLDTDSAELRGTLMQGWHQGRFSMGLGIDVWKRNGLAARDRPFSDSANQYDDFAAMYGDQVSVGLYDARSMASPYATIYLYDGQVNGVNGISIPGLADGAAITALPGTGGTAAGTLGMATLLPGSSLGQTGAGSYDATQAAVFSAPQLTRGDASAVNLFDYQDYTWLVPETTREALRLTADYDFGNGLALFSEFAGTWSRSYTQVAPLPVTDGLVGLALPANQAWNPFGVAVGYLWRPLDLGARGGVIHDRNFNALAGLRGALGDWRWEFATSYGRDSYVDQSINFLRLDLVREAAQSTDPATALNPFAGGASVHPEGFWDRLRVNPWHAGVAELTGFDLRLSRPEWKLGRWSELGVLGLMEWNHSRLSQWSDEWSRQGLVMGYFQPGAPTEYTRRSLAFAGEAVWRLFPKAEGRSWVEFRGSLRHEDFSVGDASGLRPSAGVFVNLPAGFSVRGSYADTFHAPSMLQLYAPVSSGYVNELPDPRRPVELTGDIQDGAVSRLVRSGGNPELAPETGKVWNLGLVYAPERGLLKGLSLSATWWRYDLQNLVRSLSLNDILANELISTGDLVERGVGGGSFVNNTDHDILVPAEGGGMETVSPGASVVLPGRLVAVSTQLHNLARSLREGIDWELRYRTERLGPGAWTFNASLTNLRRLSFGQTDGEWTINYAGSNLNPHWVGKLGLNWEKGPFSLGWTAHGHGHSGISGVPGSEYGQYIVHNLNFAWTIARGADKAPLHLRLGLLDLFDKTPPLYRDAPIGYCNWTVSRPQGRSIHVSLTQEW